jgi:hypothetical protein
MTRWALGRRDPAKPLSRLLQAVWDIVKRLLPERHHLIELVTADDNRTDFHF